jgi:alpha-amylase
MTAVCFYFQVHQPYRLRKFSFFEKRDLRYYFDDELNRSVMSKVSRKCYLPANELLLKLCKRYGDSVKFAFSITGVALEQLEQYAPKTLETFQELADCRDNIEFLSETYYHSLASVFDPEDFEVQVRLHSEALRRYLGLSNCPNIFRNTELIYDDVVGARVAEMGFKGILAEGPDDILNGRSSSSLFMLPNGPGSAGLKILAKNYQLSDDVAFRFCDSSWSEYPLSPKKFASWVKAAAGPTGVVNIFIDYETFGEHQWADTGIFRFLEMLPEELLRAGCVLMAPSEAICRTGAIEPLSYSRTTSWADKSRDLSAWNGNDIQKSALAAAYDWSEAFRSSMDQELLEVWRKLQTSDHFYYMCTKGADDGQVHAYFSPYDGPHDAFVNYMNCLRDFKGRFFKHMSKAA